MILSTLKHLFSYYETNCKELAHPEEDSCVKAGIHISLSVLIQSLKMYIPFYLFIHVIRWKLDFKAFVKDVLRSTLFLLIYGGGCESLNCVFDKIFNVMYKFNVIFTPCLICSSISYSIESRARQRIIAPYSYAVFIDTLARVLVSRNLLPSIPYLDVLLFMLVSGRICGRLSSSPSITGFNDSVFALLTNPMEIVARRFSSHLALSLYSTKILTKSPILKIPLLLTAGCVWGLFIGLSYNIVSMTIKSVSRLLSGAKGESATGRGSEAGGGLTGMFLSS